MNALTIYSGIVVLASITYLAVGILFAPEEDWQNEPDSVFFKIHRLAIIVTGILALALFYVSYVEAAGVEEETLPTITTDQQSDTKNKKSRTLKGITLSIILRVLVILGCIGVAFGYIYLYVDLILSERAWLYFFFLWLIWFILAFTGVPCCLNRCCRCFNA